MSQSIMRDHPTESLEHHVASARAYTEHLIAHLDAEDQCVQSMPDASPAKWHRAHTTWFFEQFVLVPNLPGYQVFDPRFQYLFNSYYESMGARHPRFARGVLTRPTADEVTAYRQAVDTALADFLPNATPEVQTLVTLGIQHEQQHQELLVTDILHAFAQNPLNPAAMPCWSEPRSAAGPTRYASFHGGIASIGHIGEGFGFDNEGPRHKVLLVPYRLATRLVRNRDFQDFIDDGGYRTATLWMAEGWDKVQADGWTAPLHWRDDQMQMTPAGLLPRDPDAPVRHISWYEADAFARWTGNRLPTEAELEAGQNDIAEFTGHVWQWTASAYAPYPGFRAAPGAVGEYNGKFMVNQMVLRGGSAATPPGHARPSYRNFFHPDKRWQFTGLRLAQDV